MHQPVREILSSHFKEKEAPGGWMENYYEYEKDSDFDEYRMADYRIRQLPDTGYMFEKKTDIRPQNGG